MKQYNTYKPSGIEWLGDIPEHWVVKRVKDLTIKIGSGVTPSGGAEVYQDSGIPFFRSQNIQNNKLLLDDIAYITEEVDSKMANSRVRPNDVLLNITGASIGRCFYAPEDFKKGNVNQHVCIIRPKRKLIQTKNLHYEFISQFGQIFIDLSQNGANREGLNFQQIKNFLFLVPPSCEQAAIANYLDTKTAAIDRKIELLTAKADKYKALRRSLINETVCRGLPASEGFTQSETLTKMKDSGIEWIGMIPEHWEVKRMKDIFCFAKGKNASKYSQEYVNDILNFGIYPVYSGQTENNGVMAGINTFDYDLQESILLVTTVGAKAMETKLITGKFSLSQNCATITLTKKRNDIRYLYYFISQLFVEERKTIPTIMQPSLRIEDLNKYFVLLPEVTEQMRIAIYLDEKTTQIDTILTNISEQINKLTQLRKTLINDVVTGKIKVTEVS